jgi:arginyl-tRNA synthetase
MNKEEFKTYDNTILVMDLPIFEDNFKEMIKESGYQFLDISKIKTTPPNMGFGFCVFGEPSQEIKTWAGIHGFKLEPSGKFTNILIPEDYDLLKCFQKPLTPVYLDGFSPNLNKELHFGHYTNFIVAKALQCLTQMKPVAILGDTLGTDEVNEENLDFLKTFFKDYSYDPELYFASKMKLKDDSILLDGEGKYEGTKVFDLGEEKQVVIKSDGSTNYFYQDIAFAQTLDNPTLILTGTEQKEHFNLISKINPNVQHKGLGLVKVKAGSKLSADIQEQKMSSRLGNVIFMKDVIIDLLEEFGNEELGYNVIAGKILSYKVSSEKKVNKEELSDHNNSEGLYISYTMARLKSAECEVMDIELQDHKLVHAWLMSIKNLEPHYLLKAVVDYCKGVNSLYQTHRIKDNDENKLMFTKKLAQIEQACKLLGLYSIDRV